MMAVTEVSAGGVIYRELEKGRLEVCLINARGKQRWQLPKGWIEQGETREEAARREVHEETGLYGEVLMPLESIEFWYVSRYGPNPGRRHKFVHHFLLRYLSGTTDEHDHEVDEARWFPIDEAAEMLSFPNEKSVLALAVQILRKRQNET